MGTRKHGLLALGLLLLCALVVLVRGTQAQASAGIVYGIERDTVEKNIFAIDFSAGLGFEPTITLVANMTKAAAEDPNFPQQCIGYVNGVTRTGPLFEFSPNGLGYDGDSRLYFAVFDRYGMTASRLCFYSFETDSFGFAATLGETVTGAAFDPYTYQYVWIDEGAPQSEGSILMLQFARLDRTTGQIVERVTNTIFRDVTTDPDAPAAEVPFTYRGGDMAIDANGVLYVSSVGTGGGFKHFFSIDLGYVDGNITTTPAMPYAYRLIHADSMDSGQLSTLTGFATADQLAFDAEGRLISQDSERGIFSVVDTETGANGELGVEGVDFVRLFQAGVLRTFADLASSLVFEAPTPTPSPSPTPTPVPTESPTPTPSPSPTPTPVPTESPTPSPSPVPTESPTPTPMPTESPTPTPVPTASPMPTPAPEFCCSPDDEGAVCNMATNMPKRMVDSDRKSKEMFMTTRRHSDHAGGRSHSFSCDCQCRLDTDSEEEEPCCPCTCPKPPPKPPVCGNDGSDSNDDSSDCSSGSELESNDRLGEMN